MTTSTLTGQLVRLTAVNTETDAAAFARWSRNTEYWRLLDSDPPMPRTAKQRQEEMDKHEIRDTGYFFGIRLLNAESLIGFTGLWLDSWLHREAFVGIGIGEPDYWGKGYGTEAMQLALRFAFVELCLHRVALLAFAYNTRAIRSYEKSGFVHEGVERRYMLRDGQRADVLVMGILRSEWEQRQAQSASGS